MCHVRFFEPVYESQPRKQSESTEIMLQLALLIASIYKCHGDTIGSIENKDTSSWYWGWGSSGWSDYYFGWGWDWDWSYEWNDTSSGICWY